MGSRANASRADASATRALSARALFSTRSTVAIRSSIRVPVNVISNIPVFFSGLGLVLFFLGRSGKIPPQSCGLFMRNGRDSQTLYPARLTIAAPGARQFLRANSNSFGGAPGAPLIRALANEWALSALYSFGRPHLAGCRVPHSFAHFANEWALSALYSFGRPHLGAARPRIAIYLFPARRHRLLGQQPVAALLRTLAKRILDDSVFERMKANHHQPSARLQHSGRRLQQCFQIVQFTVYEYSESLKGLRRRMNPLMFPIH